MIKKYRNKILGNVNAKFNGGGSALLITEEGAMVVPANIIIDGSDWELITDTPVEDKPDAAREFYRVFFNNRTVVEDPRMNESMISCIRNFAAQEVDKNNTSWQKRMDDIDKMVNEMRGKISELTEENTTLEARNAWLESSQRELHHLVKEGAQKLADMTTQRDEAVNENTLLRREVVVRDGVFKDASQKQATAILIIEINRLLTEYKEIYKNRTFYLEVKNLSIASCLPEEYTGIKLDIIL